MNSKKTKIILICSDGGHLAQMLELKEMFEKYDYLLVTEKTPATLQISKLYNVQYLKSRSSGSSRNFNFFLTLFANFYFSCKILIKHFPKAIITTGSHTAVPLCLLGKLCGVKIIWILSFARIFSRAFSADIVYPFADQFIVQWPTMQKFYKKSIYLGSIY